jgi:hypothetical protein
MWSQLIKPDEEVVEERVVKDDTLTTIPVVTGYELRFKREMKSFVEEYQYTLDKIYNKHFKDYDNITKKDFYIFANTNRSFFTIILMSGA